MQTTKRVLEAWGLRVGLAAAFVLLLVRIAPDVRTKPYHGDEAVTGLVATRPFVEMLDVVVNDRGGPPLHYVLAHLVLAIETSATALRSFSVVAALTALLVIFDLGRRLGGPLAGTVAALLAAATPFLGIYGSFGRPYALFVLMAAIALDLFVVAVERKTFGAAMGAALAAVLAAATHHYGFFLVGIEAVIGLVLWRFRSLKGLLVPLAAMFVAVPLVISFRRLSERFEIGEGVESIAGPRTAARHLYYALQGSSAGGPLFFLLFLLGVGGLVLLVRRRPPVGALALGLLVVPPATYLLVSVGDAGGLGGIAPRHLLFLLPLWTTAIGLMVAELSDRLSAPVVALAVAALVAGAAISPDGGVFDQRTRVDAVARNGDRAAVEAPAAFVARHVQDGDVLYPYSTPLLAALESSARGQPLETGPGGLFALGLEHIYLPVPGAFVVLPVGEASLDSSRLGVDDASGAFERWTAIRVSGPLETESELVQALLQGVRAVGGPVDLSRQEAVLCRYLERRGETC